MKYFSFIFNVFLRDIGYLSSLIRGRKRGKAIVGIYDNFFSQGRLKVIVRDYGLKIFFDGIEITSGYGLKVAINTLGIWTDSSMADWIITDKGNGSIEIKVVFMELPLHGIWNIKIENEKTISWKLDVETEEGLCINEIMIFYSLAADYKICSFGGCLDTAIAKSILKRSEASGVILKLSGKQHNIFQSFRLNSPVFRKQCLMGFRKFNSQDAVNYPSGRHSIFSGIMDLLSSDSIGEKAAAPLYGIANFNSSAEISGFRPQDECLAASGVDPDICNSNNRDIVESKKDAPDFSPGGCAESERQKFKRNLNILLVNLPWQSGGKWGVRAGSRWPHIKDDSEEGYLPFPFFLAYAAALLEKNNISVSIIDAIAQQINKDEFMTMILSRNLDYLVAETSIPSFYHDLEILEKVSKTGIRIILCGACSEINQIEFLKKNKFIDFVISGEYEYPLLELILSLQENKDISWIRGLIYRNNDGVIKNTPRPPFNIDLLPWPHRETLPMEKYMDNPGGIPCPSVQMLASRGCLFGCNFCLWPQVMYQGAHHRARKISSVINEMEFLVRVKKFKSVYFDDDTFNIGRERILNLCREIARRGLQVVPWAIMARADLMDEGLLLEMRKSGLAAVKYGVESSSQELIDNCGKNMNLKKAEKMILFTKSIGIKTHLTFSFGLPGETNSTIEETIDYALRLAPHTAQFSIATPFPGTRYFDDLDNKGLIIDKAWNNYDGNAKSVIKLKDVDNDGLELAKARAYTSWNNKHK